MTLPEVMLWSRLRGAPAGVRFRRQHPIGPYVVDFCCSAARLAIEVDGSGHDLPDRVAYDTGRDRYLRDCGYRVIRVAAADILEDVDAVGAAIVALAGAPLHHAVHGPPPRAGEE